MTAAVMLIAVASLLALRSMLVRRWHAWRMRVHRDRHLHGRRDRGRHLESAMFHHVELLRRSQPSELTRAGLTLTEVR